LSIIIQGYLTDKLITQGFNSKPSTPPLGLTIITSGLLGNKLITQGYYSTITPPTPSVSTAGGGAPRGFITRRLDAELTPQEKPVERVIPQPLLEGMTFEEMARYVFTSLHPNISEEELQQRLKETLSMLPQNKIVNKEADLHNLIAEIAERIKTTEAKPLHIPILKTINIEDKLRETIRKSLEEQNN
jgi:hypothetical protein